MAALRLLMCGDRLTMCTLLCASHWPSATRIQCRTTTGLFMNCAFLIVRERITRCGIRQSTKWYYYPKLTKDECLVFKVYDKKEDGPRFVFHCLR